MASFRIDSMKPFAVEDFKNLGQCLAAFQCPSVLTEHGIGTLFCSKAWFLIYLEKWSIGGPVENGENTGVFRRPDLPLLADRVKL